MEHQLLFVKRSECHFPVNEVEYLSHLISGDRVRADPKKIEDMIQWPKSTTVKALRGFLGLTWYCRKFIKSYSGIASPLTRRLKKDGFSWNEAVEQAFAQLKEAMI